MSLPEERRFLVPSEAEAGILETALREIQPKGRRTVASLVAEVLATPEGRLTVRSSRVVWWSDCLNRRHVRIFSSRTVHEPGKRIPVLVAVYPERCLFQVQREPDGSDRDALLVLCPCGAVGTPNEIGWMGNECGPCHDRRSGEEPPEQPWGIPSWTHEVPRNGPAPLFSPDGQEIFCLWPSQTARRHLAEDRVHHVREGGVAAAISPDGRFFVIADENAQCFVYRVGPQAFRRVRLLGNDVKPWKFSADGRWLVGAGTDHSLHIWNWPEASTVLEVPQSEEWLADFGPDEHLHCLRVDLRELTTIRLGAEPRQYSRAVRWQVPRAQGQTRFVFTTPDGAALIVGDNQGYLFRLDLASSTVTRKYRLSEERMVGAERTPEGDLLVATPTRTHVVDMHRLIVRATVHSGPGIENAAPVCHGHWLLLGAGRDRVRLLPWPPLRAYLLSEPVRLADGDRLS